MPPEALLGILPSSIVDRFNFFEELSLKRKATQASVHDLDWIADAMDAWNEVLKVQVEANQILVERLGGDKDAKVEKEADECVNAAEAPECGQKPAATFAKRSAILISFAQALHRADEN